MPVSVARHAIDPPHRMPLRTLHGTHGRDSARIRIHYWVYGVAASVAVGSEAGGPKGGRQPPGHAPGGASLRLRAVR